MTKAVSTRLPRRDVEQLDQLAKEEHLDRATLIRKMLIESIETEKIEKAVEKYRKGEISVGEAAQKADTTLWEIIDYLEKENITPPGRKTVEIEKEIEEARENWSSLEDR